ncbi:hypothetical protein A3H09_01680 [Candidatus Falkowbacteria bacterium RIFCSPLOWO2_12_FULL_45_13]|uniref:BioF2-like acetyltransferase domain-containing protein n=1 Tax=Candidatus Falkowbacteria bacterium RIFCSPLOWO2_12_FULL_45_13 TaxID=1797991 RepID=A0A1F5SVB4_9BACT|nr:MAG: hypothetical protein A3H09_01680 [Candidatus Falkowbacteria bacterium RIFCSPLOWO2_12_FULL_45_13]
MSNLISNKMKIESVPIEEVLKLTEFFPSFSYTKEFLKFQKKRYGLASDLLGVYDKGKLVCLLPVNYSSTAAYSVYKDYTEPFITGDEQKVDWPEVARAVKKKLGCDYFELNFGFTGAIRANFSEFKATALSFFVLRLGLGENQESFFKKFDKKTRNQIRKAEKYNFVFKTVGAESSAVFYDLYKENMGRHGTPAKPLSFFHDLFACYGEKCRLLLLWDQTELAGANLAVASGRYLRLFFSLSRVKYWQHCVNDLLYFKTIDWAYGRGVRTIDFGASSNQDKSHNHFKLGFGAEQWPILNYRQGSKWHYIKDFLRQKKYNLKIRLNKIKKGGSLRSLAKINKLRLSKDVKESINFDI